MLIQRLIAIDSPDLFTHGQLFREQFAREKRYSPVNENPPTQ